MIKNSLLLVSIALAGLILAFACSKKSGSPAQTCQIATVTDQDGSNAPTTFNLTYNDQGQLSTTETISSGSSTVTRVYTYSGNRTIITETDGTTLFSTDTITMNSDGLMATDLFTIASNGEQQVTTYTYSGDQVQQSVETDSHGATGTTTTYAWSGGNLTSSTQTTGANVTTTTYTYNNKPTQPGDYWQIIQLISYSGPFVKNTNMLTGTNSPAQIANISYNTDNTGRITGLTATYGSNVERINYNWSCH